MTVPAVVLDACVLVPIRLATTLLWFAEAGLFHPLSSELILDEVQRSLPRVGVVPEHARRRVGMMRDAMGSGSMIEGFVELIEGMGCDPKDRHVLAAAVRGDADAVVTFNLKDFPVDAASPHGIEILHLDDFLVSLVAEHRRLMVATLGQQVAAFRNPTTTVEQFLETLTVTVPMSRT